jgi:hypothetical protein
MGRNLPEVICAGLDYKALGLVALLRVRLGYKLGQDPYWKQVVLTILFY